MVRPRRDSARNQPSVSCCVALFGINELSQKAASTKHFWEKYSFGYIDGWDTSDLHANHAGTLRRVEASDEMVAHGAPGFADDHANEQRVSKEHFVKAEGVAGEIFAETIRIWHR